MWKNIQLGRWQLIHRDTAYFSSRSGFVVSSCLGGKNIHISFLQITVYIKIYFPYSCPEESCNVISDTPGVAHTICLPCLLQLNVSSACLTPHSCVYHTSLWGHCGLM